MSNPLLGLVRTPVVDDAKMITRPWSIWLERIASAARQTTQPTPENPTGTTDTVIPGAPDAVLSTSGIRFILDWNDPADGGLTLDDTCVQIDTVATFDSAALITTAGWGRLNHIERVDPDKTLYFRIALHNQSGLPSDATVSMALHAIGREDYATGWGPFCAALGPATTSSVLAIDTVLPGVPTNVTVVASGSDFVGTWGNPTTGALTLDDVCIMYDVVPTFDSVERVVCAGWGKVNTKRGTDPGKTYYFKIAWHNASGIKSDPHVEAALAATNRLDWDPYEGWGPFCAAVGPVTTSGKPVDSVIPGKLQNLDMSQSGEGYFLADWDDPITGHFAIDSIAEEYSTSKSSWVAEDGTLIWGKTNHLEGYEPLRSFYFRFAAHNNSGKPSDPSTVSLGATGWGPWTYSGDTIVMANAVLVSSGGIDSVVPSVLQNLDMSKSGGGNFVATWADPATGNHTLDLIAEEWSLSKSSWSAVEGTYVTGYSRHAEGQRSGAAYYFRFAAHNKSDKPSDANGPGAALGQNGWGPWIYSGNTTSMASATLISSGSVVASSLSQSFIRTAGTFTNNSPGAGYVAWSGVKVQYHGVEYTITNGNTNLAWIYWQLASPTVFQASASFPTLGPDGAAVVINVSGTAVYQDMPGDPIYASRIVAGTLDAISANLGSITAGTITGATLRSAASGARVEINSTDGIKGIDSGSVVRWQGKTDGYFYSNRFLALSGNVKIDLDTTGISISVASGPLLAISGCGTSTILVTPVAPFATGILSLSGYGVNDAVLICSNVGNTENVRITPNGLQVTSGNITLSTSNATVDGVDVSALDSAAVKLNVTNTFGSSAILNISAGKIIPKFVGSAPSLASGEFCFVASGGTLYLSFYDGGTRHDVAFTPGLY